MKYGCKAFVFQEQVSAAEASFEEFFKSIEAQGNITCDKRNSTFRGKLLDVYEKKYFVGAIIAESLKKKGFVQNGSVLSEQELNAKHEVCIFALRLDTNKGIFASYRGSTTINSFLQILWNKYRIFVAQKQEKASAKRKKEFSIKGKAKSMQIVSQETYAQILKKFSCIKEVNYSVVAYNSEVSSLPQSMQDQIKGMTQSVRFNLTETSKVRDFILKVFGLSVKKLKDGTERHMGRVIGYDESDQEIGISFDDYSNNLFYTSDFSDSLDLDNLQNYPGISSIIASCEESCLCL